MPVEIGIELVVVGEHRRQFRADGDPRRAGERGEIEQHVRLLAARLGQAIAHHKPPLRIRVGILHGDTLAGLQHVPWPVGIPGDRVLDGADHHPEPDRQLGRHDQLRKCERMGRTAHVLLHAQHARRRLEIQAARIEAHALPDQCHARTARAPAHVDQPRRVVRRPANRVNHRIVGLEQSVTGGHLHPRLETPGHLPGLTGKLRGAHVFRGRVDQVAQQRRRIEHLPDGSPVRPRGPHKIGPGKLRWPVAGEFIGGKPPAQGGVMGDSLCNPPRDPVAAGRQARGKCRPGPDVRVRACHEDSSVGTAGLVRQH